MSSWDCVIGYVAVDLYWGSCGREWVDISLLGTEWKGMVLLILTGDDDEENGTVNPYWGRCCRVWCRMSLLETVW